MGRIFLMPIAFYSPFTGFDQDFNKKALLFGGAILATVFWLLARFEDGKFSLPGGWIVKSWMIVLFSFVLSSGILLLGGRSAGQSIFGLGYDTDTLMTIISLMLLLFLSSMSFQDQKKMFNFYTALSISAFLVLLVELYHFYVGGSFIPGNGMISNTIAVPPFAAS